MWHEYEAWHLTMRVQKNKEEIAIHAYKFEKGVAWVLRVFFMGNESLIFCM
jgi:hypothetical protein